jgi:hypothetical protein
VVLVVPYERRGEPESQKQADRAHAASCASAERANARLESWRILRQVRCGTDMVTQLLRAAAVLANYELTSR